jgi:hypothetical protein
MTIVNGFNQQTYINGGPHIVQFTTSISATSKAGPQGPIPGPVGACHFLEIYKRSTVCWTVLHRLQKHNRNHRNDRNDPMLSVHMWRRVGPVAKMRFCFTLEKCGFVKWEIHCRNQFGVEIIGFTPCDETIAIFSTR